MQCNGTTRTTRAGHSSSRCAERPHSHEKQDTARPIPATALRSKAATSCVAADVCSCGPLSQSGPSLFGQIRTSPPVHPLNRPATTPKRAFGEEKLAANLVGDPSTAFDGLMCKVTAAEGCAPVLLVRLNSASATLPVALGWRSRRGLVSKSGLAIRSVVGQCCPQLLGRSRCESWYW